MVSADRLSHLDSVLTGIAMYEAFTKRDNDALRGMVDATSPQEAVTALLNSMEVMSGIFAAQLNTSTERVTASIRRRIIRELGTANGRGVAS